VNQLVGRILADLRAMVAPGVTTQEIDALAEARVREAGAEPAFKGYHGYPATICASLNEQVVHGIPSKQQVTEGDILSIDMGAKLDGYYGDCAVTVPVGRISADAAKLLRVTEESLFRAIDVVKPGARVSDIGLAVQEHVEANGFSGARVRRAWHRHLAARGAADRELRPRRARTAAGRRHGAGDRADGELRQAGGESARGRVDGGDTRRQPVGTLRAHGRDHSRWLRGSDHARGGPGGSCRPFVKTGW